MYILFNIIYTKQEEVIIGCVPLTLSRDCIPFILEEWRKDFRHSFWKTKEQRHWPRNPCDLNFSAQKAVKVEQAKRTTKRQGGQG